MENLIKATREQIAEHKPKGKNFITDTILDYYYIPHSKGKAQMVVELSEGVIFERMWYGVTCANNHEIYHEISKLFETKKEALNYISNLK